MQISIYEPERILHRGHDGFFNYFLSALTGEAGARPTTDPRPVPQMIQPRVHESCWVRFDNQLVFFDMSDHIQLLDLDAIQAADLYFKANLNRKLAGRILENAHLSGHASKLRPFLFFSDQLDWFLRFGRRMKKLERLPGRKKVAHIVGVYENLIRDGGEDPFTSAAEMSPAACHFWSRYHTQRALEDAHLPGMYRLVSRGNRSLEDRKTVYPNLSRRHFAWTLARSEAVVVNTLPHALFPWKVSESLAVGRPVILDVPPITEVPEPFRLQEGLHKLTLLPPVKLSDSAPLEDPASYRALPDFGPDRFAEGVARVRECLYDRPKLKQMQAACRDFAEQAYTPKKVAHYICETVQANGETSGT